MMIKSGNILDSVSDIFASWSVFLIKSLTFGISSLTALKGAVVTKPAMLGISPLL